MFFFEFAEFIHRYFQDMDENLKQQLGGVFPDEDIKNSANGNIVLGEYRVKRPEKPKIVLYYGSFKKILPERDPNFWKKKIIDVIHHELTHHIEYLNGTNKMGKEEIWRKRSFDFKELIIFLFITIIIFVITFNIMERFL
ncbi:MAG: hypothetical protein C0601_11910 [Candidatus Muiribacterium halophilum]|uniref:Neutral zinc metallopeptidase n=1 Tax=Muiribacterium halophilum TaxID=2053465 RepID=A0A2N5ZB44_MUIH1|nr:MAG: hypothetical protein C0601_11910 [Candidatus Muirbacterium halophilum]